LPVYKGKAKVSDSYIARLTGKPRSDSWSAEPMVLQH